MNIIFLLWESLLDLAYPRHCLLCRGFIDAVSEILCGPCQKEIVPVSGSRCRQCGRPIDSGPCPSCRNREYEFEQLFVLYDFDKRVRSLIHLLKYQEKVAVGQFLGREMGLSVRAQQTLDPETLIVPVPLHASRKRERGYNQSTILARAMGAVVNRPVCEKTLKRVRATETQTALNLRERTRNVDGAFEVCRPVGGRPILLVDDVVTTGSTLSACARVLKDGGSGMVYAVAAACPFGSELETEER